MGKFIDLVDKKINHWFVIKRVHNDTNNKPQFLCSCGCGTIKTVKGKTLREGTSKGCRRCMSRRTKRTDRFSFKHGLCHSRTYKSWVNIIARCHNTKDTAYKWYGAKGIKVCDRWRADFLNFLEDMGERPQKRSVDRIDNEKGYTKENCRWASTKTQSRNTRRSKKNGTIINDWKIIKRVEVNGIYKAKAKCTKCNRSVVRTQSSLKERHCHCPPPS